MGKGEFLSFEDIKKFYKKREVLKDISFKVNRGEIFGLVGRSGCGKSTLFKILTGMVQVDSGKIVFEGKNVLRKFDYLRKNTGFATQENLLFDELSVRENANYFGDLYDVKKKDIEERFKKLVLLLKIGGFENTLIKHLSGGMAKRANLLVSLIHNPKLLILDEPTTGLDSLLRNALWSYIHKINDEGTTIIVTSHFLDEIEKNCDRIAILRHGTIIKIGSPEQYKYFYGKNKSFKEIFEDIILQKVI